MVKRNPQNRLMFNCTVFTTLLYPSSSIFWQEEPLLWIKASLILTQKLGLPIESRDLISPSSLEWAHLCAALLSPLKQDKPGLTNLRVIHRPEPFDRAEHICLSIKYRLVNIREGTTNESNDELSLGEQGQAKGKSAREVREEDLSINPIPSPRNIPLLGASLFLTTFLYRLPLGGRQDLLV